MVFKKQIKYEKTEKELGFFFCGEKDKLGGSWKRRKKRKTRYCKDDNKFYWQSTGLNLGNDFVILKGAKPCRRLSAEIMESISWK